MKNIRLKGLDHEAFVWNTNVKERIFLLRGHNHPLVGVKCLPDSPQIITADTSGTVKVWDVRFLFSGCIQTFNVNFEEMTSFCLTYPKKKIIAGGKKLKFYEYDEPKDQYLAHERFCTQIVFSDVLSLFITLHPDSIKIWDAKNGKLLNVYRELSKDELSYIKLDNRQRKLFVATCTGKLFTLNIKNGAKMKKFQKNDTPVSRIQY